MSEGRQLRARKLVPVVLLPPVGEGRATTKKGAGKSAPTKEAQSATAVEASGNAVADTVAPQAVGPPTRSKKKADASVNAIVNTGATPAVKRPRRSKKKSSKAVKKAPVRNSDHERSGLTTENESVTDTDASNNAVVDDQPTPDEPSTTAAGAMVNQEALSSDATQAVVTMTKGALSTSEQQDTAQSKIPKSTRAYGRQKEVMDVDDPETTPTQNLVSRDNRRKDDLPDAAEDIFYNRNPNGRASNASASASSGLPLGLQATLRSASARVSPSADETFAIHSTLIPINDSSGFLPSSPLSRTTGPAPRSRGLYKIRNQPDIPPLNVIDPALNSREPLTPDPASSDEEFDSTMPSDDGLPLPSASAVPHPGTNYFCRIGRAIEDLGYVGYRSRIGLAGPEDWAAYAPYTCWYNRASHQWEQLPPGYTTDKPRALHDLAEVEAWWVEAEIIAQERADELDDESAGAKESGQEAVEVESGGEKESGGPKEDDNQAESMPNADQDGEKAYRSSSCGSGSDFGETEEAKARQREWARKNRGRGHDEMDTAEEEDDDERRMEEEDEQDRRRMSKKKGRKGRSSATRSNELGENQVSRGRQLKRVARKSKDNGGSTPGEIFAQKLRRLVKSKPPAQRPSAEVEGSDADEDRPSKDDGGSDPSDNFAQKLHRLAKSKPPAQRPSAEGEGSDADEERPSEVPTAHPVASTKALGKRRDDPAESMKRGPFTAHETQLAMELADTIVAHCKNMGRTPESVLRKGGFNVSLSREASRWDIWQMYLRYQPYNPRKSGGSWVTQAAAMYNNIVEKLSPDQMDKFVEEMVAELAELRPETDGQEFKITKTALKQVQDLATALGRADVDMIGIIIPRDPVANQAATVLTGNTHLQGVIEHCQADIKQMLHHLTTLLRGMDSKLIAPKSVNLAQLLGRDVANIPQSDEVSLPKSPTMPRRLKKPSKPSTKASKTAKAVANPIDPDLNLPITAVPAAYWECRPTEITRDRARRCVPQLLKFQMVEWAGPEVAAGSSVWANFLTHCRDAQMVLERWPCKEPFPGAKGWSVSDISSPGITVMFTYLMSKDDELKDLAPRIVAWSDDHKSLDEGSEEWREIPIVTGVTESGEVKVLARIKNCQPEVHNAARQKDGGPDVAPLLRARARSQAIDENTLKVTKKKTTKSTQSDAQKRKLREEPKPQPKVIYVEDPPSDDDSANDSRPPVPTKLVHRQGTSHQAADPFPQQPREPKPRPKVVYNVEHCASDEEMADGTRPAVNSPTASPPAKRVRREDTSNEAAGSVQQQARNYHGSRQQKAQDPRVAYQRQVRAPEDSGPEASRTMNPHPRPQHPRPEQNDSGSEPVHKPRGTSQRPSAQDEAASEHAGGFQFRAPQAHYYNDVNMHDEEEHNAYMEDYHHPVRMDNQHLRLPPQFANNQLLGQHPRQYGPSGFGGRGRGGRPQYRGYVHPYEFGGYYGQAHDGFTGYGNQRSGRGPLESGDESDRFSEVNPLRRQYPGEGHGF